ncbi:MAG: NADH-dependent alcohol dehydrogenase, partial [Aeromonas veronii]
DAIAATRDFFERMGVKTRLRDYGLKDLGIDTLIGKLGEHGMTRLGEHGDIDLVQSQHIYEAAW